MELPQEIREKIVRYRRAYPKNSKEHPDDIDLLETYRMISGKEISRLKKLILKEGETV